MQKRKITSALVVVGDFPDLTLETATQQFGLDGGCEEFSKVVAESKGTLVGIFLGLLRARYKGDAIHTICRMKVVASCGAGSGTRTMNA